MRQRAATSGNERQRAATSGNEQQQSLHNRHLLTKHEQQQWVDYWPTRTTANGYLRFVALPH